MSADPQAAPEPTYTVEITKAELNAMKRLAVLLAERVILPIESPELKAKWAARGVMLHAVIMRAERGGT